MSDKFETVTAATNSGWTVTLAQQDDATYKTQCDNGNYFFGYNTGSANEYVLALENAATCPTGTSPVI